MNEALTPANQATHVFPIHPYLLLVELDWGREYRLFDCSHRLAEPAFAPLADLTAFRQVVSDPVAGAITWPAGASIPVETILDNSLPLAFPPRLPGYIRKPPG